MKNSYKKGLDFKNIYYFIKSTYNIITFLFDLVENRTFFLLGSMRPIRRNRREYLRSLRRHYYSDWNPYETYQFLGSYTSEELMKPLLDIKLNNSPLMTIKEGSAFEDTYGEWCDLIINGGFIIPTNAQLKRSGVEIETIFDILNNSDIPSGKVAEHEDAFERLETSLAAGLKLSGYKKSTLSFQAQMTEDEETMDTRSWELIGEFSEDHHSEAIDNQGKFEVSLRLNILYSVILYKGPEDARVLAFDIPNFALPAVIKRLANWFKNAR